MPESTVKADTPVKTFSINFKTIKIVAVTTAVVAAGTALVVYKVMGGPTPEIVLPDTPAVTS